MLTGIKSVFRLMPALVIGLALGWMLASRRALPPLQGEAASLHTGPTIQQVQALASLVTLKVDDQTTLHP